jgi:CheY-like chemotaxis protein
VTPGKYVLLQVVDNGTGIPKEAIERIFEPFFTTKEIGKGTGLGLSTVLGIVRSHGGFVNVYSEPGQGTTFKVYIPAQLEGVVVEPARIAEGLPRGNGELILVVDDEAAIRDITKQTLETFGYRVATAEDGAEAIGMYAADRTAFAVVITDMMMPVMDGLSLIAALKRISPEVRIIAASGLNANANLAKATSAGVKGFLAKPYSADTMLILLKEILKTD